MKVAEKIEKYIDLISDRNRLDKFTEEEQDPIYDLEEEILTAYGLPGSFYFSTLLQKMAVNEDDSGVSVELFMELISLVAEEYLTSSPKTNREILIHAKEHKLSCDNVLMYMDIITHTYCVFVYEQLYMRNIITIEEALYALEYYKRNEDDINPTLLYSDDFDVKINFDKFFELKNNGAPYIEEYLKHEIDVRLRTEADDKDLYSIAFDVKRWKKFIEVDKFYIVKIEVNEEDDNYECHVDIVYQNSFKKWLAAVIICDKIVLELFLDNSRFAIHASLLRSNIEEGVRYLNLRKHFKMKHLEINGLSMKLKKETDSDFYVLQKVNINNPYYYNENITELVDKRDDLPF